MESRPIDPKKGDHTGFPAGAPREKDHVPYQCHVITTKGRWGKKSREEVEVDLYRPKQAFLGAEDEEGGEMVEATAATMAVLESEDEGHGHSKTVEFSGEEDEERVVCIVPPTIDG